MTMEESMESNRSRVEIVALWAQLVLVLVAALSIAQGAVSLDGPDNGHGWVMYLPLLCVLPAAAAFRATRAAAVGVLAGSLAAFAGFCWYHGTSWGSLPFALSLTWPLFVAAALLWLALRNRLHREREASLLRRHTRANRAELEESEVCGCIHCERVYSPIDILRWVEDRDGETAVCPHCGTDAVVGSACGIPITPSVLRRTHERWFLVG